MPRSDLIRAFAGLAVLAFTLSACTQQPDDNTAATENDETTPAQSSAADEPQTADATDDLPAPIAQMRARGFEIVGRFDTPTDLVGYAATFQGQSMALYVTPDGDHAVIGTMIDDAGDNLTSAALETAIAGPRARRAWQQFENDGDWVQDGDADAPRVVYEITDPNCPYCARFNELARPWVTAGAVQIRHVMVGVIGRDSLPKAATIVSADDPAAMLMRNFSKAGINVANNLPDAARARIRSNNEQMQSLGYRATPTILYRADNGDIKASQGMPRGDEVEAILGPRPDRD